MTTETKKKFIRFCRSRKVDKVTIICAACGIALSVLSCFVIIIKPLLPIIFILSYLGILLTEARRTIARKRDEVVINNNLLQVILSDNSMVDYLFCWIVIIPIITILDVNIFCLAAITIILLFICFKLSAIIAGYFDKKLLK